MIDRCLTNLLTNVVASLAVATVLAGSASANGSSGTVDPQINHQLALGGQMVDASDGFLPFDRHASLPRRTVVQVSPRQSQRDPYDERSTILAQADLPVEGGGSSPCAEAGSEPASQFSSPDYHEPDSIPGPNVCVFFGFGDDAGVDNDNDTHRGFNSAKVQNDD